MVGVNAQFLFHFVEGNMLPVPEPTIETATVSEEHESVLVSVKRSLPLSSSHGGQPLRLAFVVPGGHVFVSESFQVLAKQGKAGTPLKAVAHKRVPPVTEMRAEARAAIAMYTSHALVSDAGLSTHGPLQVTLPVDASIAAIVSCSAHRYDCSLLLVFQ